MRNLGFLVVGLALMLLAGFWLAHSMVPTVQDAVVTAQPVNWTRQFPLWQLLVLAWASAFIVRPSWLRWAASVVVVFVGTLLAVWDGPPDDGKAFSIFDGYRWSLFELGMLMIASQVIPVARWALQTREEESP